MNRTRHLFELPASSTNASARWRAGGLVLVLGLATAGLSLVRAGESAEDPPARESAAVEDAEVVVHRLLKKGRDDSWLYLGSTIHFEASAFLTNAWRNRRLEVLEGDADFRALVKHGPAVAPFLHKTLAKLPAEHAACESLAVALGRIGTRESMPVLIEGLRRAVALRNKPDGYGAWQSNSAAATWALWELSGRQLEQSPDAWDAWWRAVGPVFVPARDRARATVRKEQVEKLVKELADTKPLMREPLIVLGPNAVPHLLDLLPAAANAKQMEIAWVIDDLGTTARLSRDLRRDYFTYRLLSAEGPVHSEQARQRAFAMQSFADFCRTAIAVEEKSTDDNRALWGWAKSSFPRTGPLFDDPAREVPPAVPLLIKAMDHDKRRVRNLAIQIAGHIGMDTKVVPKDLVEALDRRWKTEQDDWMRHETAICFARFETSPLLRQSVKEGLWSKQDGILGDSADLVGFVSRLFDRRRDADVFARLVELTDHANERVRCTSVRSLRYLAPDLLAPHLERLVQEPSTWIKTECAITIGELKKAEHADLLLQLARDKNSTVRDWALGRLGDPVFRKALPGLVPLLRDKDDMYRAMWAMVGMGGDEATAALMKELEQGNTVGDTIYQALHKLTGKEYKTREEWLKWWGTVRPR